jgi:acetoin utilization deacetylase AcuC-like enzyme
MLKIAWSEIYVHPLPAGHRFPMEKYALLPEQLMYEGTVKADNFFRPTFMPEELILSTHTAEYWQKLKNLSLSKAEMRATGFPLSQGLIDREIIIAQGTMECAKYALQSGIAMNVSGGTHHAFSNRGEGFCLLNDIAIAANYLLINQLAKKILIIDLDVHQGNGTAELFRNQPLVFTFSMHAEKNYPLRKEKSDLDIGLPDGTTDEFYLQHLQTVLPYLLAEVQPDFVFYLAGVDILASDKLGRLAVSREGCKNRDRMVLNWAKQHQIPICVSMGGGYSPKISDIVEAHANTFRLAQEIYF